MTTFEVGAKSAKECTKECLPGQFLFPKEICALCPTGFFQQNPGSLTCQRCPPDTTTSVPGATNLLQCRPIPSGCGNPQCSGRGKCFVNGVCKCDPGYAATDCSVAIDLCSAAYCLNGGSCIFSAGNGSFCDCLPGFKGLRCESYLHFTLDAIRQSGIKKFNQTTLRRPCDAINSCPNGACSGDVVCDCNQNFGETGIKKICAPLGPCDFRPCLNGGSCVQSSNVTSSAFKCDCGSGWGGQFCQNSLKNCSLENTCKNGGECVYEINEVSKVAEVVPSLNYYSRCICPSGFGGNLCEVNISSQQNPCSNSSMCNENGVCHQYLGSRDYYCECNDGYFGEFCEAALNSCSPELEGYWECGNGGICHSKGPILHNSTSDRNNFTANATCTCLPGWHGDHCQLAEDHCLKWECTNGGSCANLFHHAHCVCKEGYTGEHCEQNIDSCIKYPHGDPLICGGHGECTSVGQGYNAPHTCTCHDAWLESQSCMQYENVCTGPVTTAKHERTVRFERTRRSVDIFSKGDDIRCTGNGTCLPQCESAGTFLCACNSGHYGKQCDQMVDYCALNNICMDQGVCANILDTVSLAVVDYECRCAKGFSGLNCEKQEAIDPCNPNPCKNDGQCQPNLNEDTYICRCSQGYNSTDDCATRINRCEATPNYCNKGTCMVMKGTNYTYCNCPAQYTGIRCETRKNQNFNLYFSGTETSTVRQTVISKNEGVIALLKSGYTLCAWVKIGADSSHTNGSAGSLKSFAMIGIVQEEQVVKQLAVLSGAGAVIGDDLVYLNHTLSHHVWHHICFVFKPYPTDSTAFLSDLHLYVDGILVESSENNLIQPPDTLTDETQAAVFLGQAVGENPPSFVGEISLVQVS